MRSNQDLHCLTFDASLCDTDTNIHFFGLSIFSSFVTFLFNVCAHFHCYLAHAYTNTRCESKMHLKLLPLPPSTQVKTLLYTVGRKARESSDTSMSTCHGVRHIPRHWKINKTLALLLLIGGCSLWLDPE